MPAPRGPRAPDSSLVSRLNATIQMRPANNLMRVDKYYRSADLLDRQVRGDRRWVKAARTRLQKGLGAEAVLLKPPMPLVQARQYRRQANEEQLYVMLMRLVSLVVETIPQHSGFHREDPVYQALRKVGRGLGCRGVWSLLSGMLFSFLQGAGGTRGTSRHSPMTSGDRSLL